MRILVIRRDNIGDLVCTTPLLHALRQRYPDAWIGVLANSYNVAVLQGNPDVNEVFAYRKAKHRGPGESRWAIWLETALLMWKLRRRGIDVAIVASPGGDRYARMIGARRIIADKPANGLHEVERCVAMLGAEAPAGRPGPLQVRADAAQAQELAAKAGLGEPRGRRVAVHISARRPKQRWPVAAFAATIRGLLREGLADQVLLFWSPGSQDDPAHPGDDEKLADLMAALPGERAFPVPTYRLGELVAGLSLCDLMVCADGGAMHIAAGLGKPVACLFGDSDVARWHPWGVPHAVIRPASHDVRDATPEEVLAACRQLVSSLVRRLPVRPDAHFHHQRHR